MSNSIENYDPHIFTEEEAALAQYECDREFGIPKQAYPAGPVGSRVNMMHFASERAMRDEFGWHGTTMADLAKQWGLG